MYMTNEDWKYKIINASPQQLVIVTYEVILDRINAAQALLERGDMDGFRAKINNAREFVNEMLYSLDTNCPVSAELTNLYFFVNKLLTKAYFMSCGKMTDTSRTDANLKAAAGIIKKLMNGLKKEVKDTVDVRAELCETYTCFCGYRVSG